MSILLTKGMKCLLMLIAIMLGLAVFPCLPADEHQADPEVTEPPPTEVEELRAIIRILGEEIAPMEELISLHLVDTPLRVLISYLATKHDINLIGGEMVTGYITARLRDVPLGRVFQALLNANGFMLVDRDGLFYEVLSLTAEARRELEKEAIGTVIQAFRVEYADLDLVSASLIAKGIVIPAQITNSPDTSQLIVQATPGRLREVEKLIQGIDIRPPQILIRVRIVEVRKETAAALGIEWATADWLAGELGEITGDVWETALTAALGHVVPGVPPTLTLALARPDNGITLALEALSEKGMIEVLSAPRLVTTNNREAIIEVVNHIPIIHREIIIIEGEPDRIRDFVYRTEPVGLTLEILPRQVGVDEVLVRVAPALDELFGMTDTDPPHPIISERRAETEVILRAGEWLVMGGLVTASVDELRKKVPLLGDIPLLGALFRSTRHEERKSDLLILVNAEILDREAVARDVDQAREAQERLRIEAR